MAETFRSRADYQGLLRKKLIGVAVGLSLLVSSRDAILSATTTDHVGRVTLGSVQKPQPLVDVSLAYANRYLQSGTTPIMDGVAHSCMDIPPVVTDRYNRLRNPEDWVRFQNQVRAVFGLSELFEDSRMDESAQNTADYLTENNLFEHVRNNETVGMNSIVNYSESQATKLGENIGLLKSLNPLDTAKIAACFLDSPSHAQNILEPDWDEVGVGVSKYQTGPHQGRYAIVIHYIDHGSTSSSTG